LDTLIKNQANCSKKYCSDNLDKLLKYYKKEIHDSKYQQLVEIYPALGGLLEAVEEYEIEDWIAKCIQYMVNKTIDEKQPIFIGMAQSVTKVLDKIECNITTMHGIQYNETFVDFLIVLISIRINVSNFSKLINNWRCAYNYSGPVICAKDQTKIAEMIEVDRCRAQFVGSVIPGIPPLVITALLSDQKETLANIIEENNLVVKHLNCTNAKLVGLYFDGAPHDRNWLERNMHNSGTHIVPIGNYVMSTEHLWQLYIIYKGKSGLTTDVLNPKDKQSDELAERFYSSRILRAYAWSGTIFFAATWKYIKNNPSQCNSKKYGISWQTKDDFLYLGYTLILLISYFPQAYAGIPLCFWLISIAFLEHIFGYAHRLIEDLTLLNFLIMNEKIMKNIDIEMKDLLDPELSLFSTEFEIGNILEK
ncbi:20737_t:CDS:2, partial [Gigaspora margarita]